MFSKLSTNNCQEIAEAIDVEFGTKDTFIKKMGSKAIDGSGGKRNKAPHLRKQVAERIVLSDLSLNVRRILLAWLDNGGFSMEEARALFDAG